MDSWDMCCAFLGRIMTFGDNSQPTNDECQAFELMELEIIKALNENMLTPSEYGVVFSYYRVAKDRKKEYFGA